MAGRGRAAVAGKRAGAAGARAESRPLLYTAQDVARFCEVDLKTIHHWADGGKIPHHRTEGRHLRFRRNHLVGFLRAHGYPLHDELASARPTVFIAGGLDLAPPTSVSGANAADAAVEDLARRLAARFFVRRFDSAIAAVANLVAGEPDALILSLDDVSIAGARTIAALKADAGTAWTVLVVVTDDPSRAPGAEIVTTRAELSQVVAELVKRLALD
jgi:excisionase family DNA binding protein